MEEINHQKIIEAIKNKMEKNTKSKNLFSDIQLSKMRAAYSGLNLVDPGSPTYKRLTDMLDDMSDDQLVQVAKAGIKFVSKLAINRVFRRGLKLE
jgi:hypothetical protein